MKRYFAAIAAAAGMAAPAAAQYDAAATAKWSAATVIHYEAVGEIADKHVRLPAEDADLYGDVTDKVTLSFDWDKSKQDFVGAPKFQNYPATVSNLVSIEKGCPVGKLNGPYEHFDIKGVRRTEAGAIELVGERIHPDTMVAQACGSALTPFKGGVEPLTEYTAPPDPMMLALGVMMPATGPVKISADGKSLILTALNNNWVWTFTPSAK